MVLAPKMSCDCCVRYHNGLPPACAVVSRAQARSSRPPRGPFRRRRVCSSAAGRRLARLCSTSACPVSLVNTEPAPLGLGLGFFPVWVTMVRSRATSIARLNLVAKLWSALAHEPISARQPIAGDRLVFFVLAQHLAGCCRVACGCSRVASVDRHCQQARQKRSRTAV